MIAIYIVIGFIGGGIITYLLCRLQQSKIEQTKSLTENENEQLRKQFEEFSTERETLKTEHTKLSSDNIQLSKDKEILINEKSLLEETKNNLKSEKEILDRLIETLREENKNLSIENSTFKTREDLKNQEIREMKENFDRERILLEESRKKTEENAEKLRRESDLMWQTKLDKLKEEFNNSASKLLSDKQEKLQQNNKEQIGEILQPIKEQFEAFRKTVEDSKTSNEVNKKELKESFESTMKLFAQQQDKAVEEIKKETLKIGTDAVNLTNALKRDTKKQGNWGEYILETLLESSGLTKDLHYFVQDSVKDEEGKIWRPDVVVKFPEGRAVIIDSKASLTAYTEAFETDDEDFRRRRLKDHAKSVRKHVDELADKPYEKVVTDAIGFILMFIPNDQCYLAAIEEDPELSRYAYERGIVIISPSNLMMALQLANNMWKQDQRNKNQDNIIKEATDLYDKIAGFTDNILKLESQIQGLNSTFQTAKNQLFTGKGNILRRVEKLKDHGLQPKKQIGGFESFKE